MQRSCRVTAEEQARFFPLRSGSPLAKYTARAAALRARSVPGWSGRSDVTRGTKPAKRKSEAKGGRSGWAAVGMCPSLLFPETHRVLRPPAFLPRPPVPPFIRKKDRTGTTARTAPRPWPFSAGHMARRLPGPVRLPAPPWSGRSGGPRKLATYYR